MRVKPKEVLVNLPVVFTFDNEDEVAKMAANFNTFVHGKVKLKYDVLGSLTSKIVAIFYFQRNGEFQQLRDEFMTLIEAEEMGQSVKEYTKTYCPQETCGTCWNDVDDCTCTPVQPPKYKKPNYSLEEIREMRDRGILINDDGVFCQEVPECCCGLCRPGWGNWTP